MCISSRSIEENVIQSECDAAVSILSVLCTIGVMISYIILCFDYPRGNNSTGLVIAKVWGAIAILIISFVIFSVFWGVIFQ